MVGVIKELAEVAGLYTDGLGKMLVGAWADDDWDAETFREWRRELAELRPFLL